MIQDLVSIITPSYNCGRFVAETIRSVQAQTYTNWEMLFVDDCSTDDTESIVKSFNDPRIRFFKNEKNSGAAVSRNWALREAKGRWIAFLDSDDLWMPEKLEHQIRFMEENDYHFSCTSRIAINEDSTPLGLRIKSPMHITKKMMWRYCWVGCLTVMYDANVMGCIQIADIKKNNDYAIWLKAIKKADCYSLEEVLACYRRRAKSISRNANNSQLRQRIKLIKWHYKLFRESENLSVISSCYCTLRNIFWGQIKKMTTVEKYDI